MKKVFHFFADMFVITSEIKEWVHDGYIIKYNDKAKTIMFTGPGNIRCVGAYGKNIESYEGTKNRIIEGAKKAKRSGNLPEYFGSLKL